ncbi:hypothetical protein NPIL_438631 [Nephila pilipes]|uniref:Fibrinogen C-terminal domain-containing protein n=1 Tax=Nephila pilipes TaxID=299642 RepID=A0A8X6PCT6_NEPPI|nr:hypothetical protein NPIL_438631 [Nephila pilipes]
MTGMRMTVQQTPAHISPYGDSMIGTHNNKKFTTKDKDNDIHKEGNCAVMCKGAWWYDSCHSSNLNGNQALTEDDIIIIDDQDSCDSEKEPSKDECCVGEASSEKAFHYPEMSMKVLKQQENDVAQQLSLKRLRDEATKKKIL